MMDLEGFLRHVESSTVPLLQAIADLNLQSVPINNDSPRALHLEQRARSATIKPPRLDITTELQALGLDPSVAGEQGRRFDDLIETERASAAKDLSELAYRIVRGPEISGRNLEALLDRTVFIAQRQFEERAQRTKATALEIAREQINFSPRHSHGEHSDSESDNGDIRINDPDSDSEEAVNIECYYPVLEEMFLRGVVRPSRNEKLKLSEHTGIPYYNLGIWFQNRRDRGPHAGKGEWMRKYTESRSITPASHVSATNGAETDDSVSDHGMSEFDEDEWETDPEDVPDLNLLELGPLAPDLPGFSISSSSCQSYPIPDLSVSDSTPSTPFASSSRSISFGSSSDSFSRTDSSFVSTGASRSYTFVDFTRAGPFTVADQRVFAIIWSTSDTNAVHVILTLRFTVVLLFRPSLTVWGTQMRSNTPSTGPSTPDEGPRTPPTSSFEFDFGLSPAVNDPSSETPPMTLRSFNFEFSLTPSPNQGKFNDVDLSFGSFDIAPYSSVASFFDSFNADLDTPLRLIPRQIVQVPIPTSGVNENNWRPDPTPEPTEVGSQEDTIESRLLAAAASVVSKNPNQQPHNPSPFKLALDHPTSPRQPPH
ncbi:hypothetical protein BS47DRAFT_1393156 [Hydnum rufescens UP504]|uniref:Homeobox domain-containing protein n=1 Tax=Hydnum rufescens UP504 TaxID=1448309 RepID=A0A9P6AXF6_9AGAM|nr:hypothetical protein BS47DRAFT_1393156 [Hydnum rufescens UP504]